MNNHLKVMSAQLFGKRLREARIATGLTMGEFAEKIKLPKSSLSYYETGSAIPSLDKSYLIAKSLNISLDYLVGDINTPNIRDYAFENFAVENHIDVEKLKALIVLMN